MGLKIGDIIMVNFSPTQGHEQRGHRPALVVSEEALHKNTGIVWLVPITSATDKFPTHIPLTTKQGVIKGTVLCEHIQSIAPAALSYKLVDEATIETIEKCKSMIDAITHI